MKHSTMLRRFVRISRKGLRGIIGVIQKILGEVKIHDQNRMNESESISLNYVH